MLMISTSTWMVKMFAMPRAKHRIMERMPSLCTERVISDSGDVPCCSETFLVRLRKCGWQRRIAPDIFQQLTPRRLGGVTVAGRSNIWSERELTIARRYLKADTGQYCRATMSSVLLSQRAEHTEIPSRELLSQRHPDRLL